MAAAALPQDREYVSHFLGVALSPDWPLPDLLDVLPIQASAPPSGERFGVWVVIERESATVVGTRFFRAAGRRGRSRSRIQHRPESAPSWVCERGSCRLGHVGARSAGRREGRRSLRRRQRGITSHPRPRWIPPDRRNRRSCPLGVRRGVNAPLAQRHSHALHLPAVIRPGNCRTSGSGRSAG
jgi:hypothetical protein